MHNKVRVFSSCKGYFMKATVLFMGFFLGLNLPAFSQEAAATLRQIQISYNLRFDNTGHYINNPAVRDQFIATQNAAVQKLRAAGNLQKSFRVTNNALSDLVVTVSLVQETNGVFAGLLVERSHYDSRDEEALLRLFNIPILLNGMDVLTYNGVSLVHLQSSALSPEQGGTISIRYPTDYQKRTFAQADFAVLKTTAGNLSFFTPARVWFSQVSLDIWLNIFAQNFGVQAILFK